MHCDTMYPARVWIQRRYNARYKVVQYVSCKTSKESYGYGLTGLGEVAAMPPADIERWESDTDSEGSDEEVDFKEGSNLSNTQVLALCM